MHLRTSISAVAIVITAGIAQAACPPIRVGYTNQQVEPYYMGAGALEANPPGAGVELIREVIASLGCPITLVRMPPLRVAVALELGQVDIAPASEPSQENNSTAYPLDKSGKPDRKRSIKIFTVVFVRSADKVALHVDPARYLVGKKVGVTHGSLNAAAMRQAGMDVDDGAQDVRRNFDKLKMGRIDAYVASLTSPGDMDSMVQTHYGDDITRLEKPIREANIWLATSRAFYNANPELAEAMWSWVAQNGRVRLSQLLKKYDKDQ